MKKNRQILGKGIAPGYVCGRAYIYEDILERDYKLYSIEKNEIEREYERVETAFQKVLDDLSMLTKRIEQELDSDFADIFRSHKMILRDPSILQEIKTELYKEWVNAEHIVKTVFMRYQNKLFSMEHNLLRARADDMADLAKRIISSLMGVEPFLETFPSGVVLVTQRFLPSDTIFLKKNAVSGIVVEYCGSASHSAILARQIGIPVVTDITDITGKINNGNELLLDGISGYVIIEPDAQQKRKFCKKAEGECLAAQAKDCFRADNS